MRSLVLSIGMTVLFSASCLSNKEGEKTMESLSAPAVGQHHTPELWFKGTVEEAFQLAQAKERPIFLYWGAVWCPPCNELKAEVFSKPRFAELMESFVPVYLDGDTEAAQIWSERLHVTGYPTILVLNHKGEESMRMMETVNIQEFEAALGSAVEADRHIGKTLDKARQGQASVNDWRLIALLSWGQLAGLELSATEQLTLLRDLTGGVPETLTKERAVLAARLLESAATSEDPATKSLVEGIRADSKKYLDRVFASLETERAARATLIYMSEEIVKWLHPTAKGKDYDMLKGRWLKAAKALADDATLSVDNRLWANHPVVAFSQLENPKGPIDPFVRDLIVKEAALADSRATTAYQRHAVISGAVELLAAVGELDRARQLLDHELARTDTPWYYESSYSSLEKRAGHPDLALQWAEKARLSAKGRASRLQWIVSNLVLVAKLDAKDVQHLAELAGEYYKTAFDLADGFSGRNASRAKVVADHLRPFAKKGQVADVVSLYAGQCKSGKSKDGTKCAEHFAAFAL